MTGPRQPGTTGGSSCFSRTVTSLYPLRVRVLSTHCVRVISLHPHPTPQHPGTPPHRGVAPVDGFMGGNSRFFSNGVQGVGGERVRLHAQDVPPAAPALPLHIHHVVVSIIFRRLDRSSKKDASSAILRISHPARGLFKLLKIVPRSRDHGHGHGYVHTLLIQVAALPQGFAQVEASCPNPNNFFEG